MTKLYRLLQKNETALLKTASYYVVHLVVAAGVAYAVTGDAVAALTLSLLEPTVQMLFFFLHEKIWEKKTQGLVRAACCAPPTAWRHTA